MYMYVCLYLQHILVADATDAKSVKAGMIFKLECDSTTCCYSSVFISVNSDSSNAIAMSPERLLQGGRSFVPVLSSVQIRPS